MEISATWKPDASDYFEALLDQNPWHQLGYVPEGLSYKVQRLLTQKLWPALLERPGRYQIILGPRRVGKTVCLYQTIQKLIDAKVPPQRLWFMRMDHPLFLDFELGGWVRSLVSHEKPTKEDPLYLFLDEVNYSKRWDLWLKTFFDEQWPVRIVATSSSVAALRKGRLESGIGRWSEQFLTPYSYSEYLGLMNEPSSCHAKPALSETLRLCMDDFRGHRELRQILDLYMLVGGFPEIILNELDVNDLQKSMLRSQQTLRSEAVQKVTGMDLPQVFHVQHTIELERLLYLLAGQMCGLFSAGNLANILSITRQTITQYVEYLEKAFLIFTLPSYSRNEESVQRRGRKVYFVDGAVRNAALQRGITPASDHRERGLLVENVAASHLYALCLQNNTRLYHWRDKQDEVDLVYDDPNGPMAFEITSASRHSLKGLEAFRQRYPQFKDSCYLISSQSELMETPSQSADGIGRLPLGVFLRAVGGCISKALEDRLAVV